MRERHRLSPWNARQHLTFGGGGGIRTHDTLARIPVFETGAFNRSATPPKDTHFAIGRVWRPLFDWLGAISGQLPFLAGRVIKK